MKREKLNKKLFIGLKTRMSNKDAEKEIPKHWDRFFKEDFPKKITNKMSDHIIAVYTDYEEDFTKPYTYLVGYEVSNLEEIPEGLVGRVIPESEYAVYTAEGIPSLIKTWQEIWESQLKRSYTTDFEIYPPDFSNQKSPEIKLYISLHKKDNGTQI